MFPAATPEALIIAMCVLLFVLFMTSVFISVMTKRQKKREEESEGDWNVSVLIIWHEHTTPHNFTSKSEIFNGTDVELSDYINENSSPEKVVHQKVVHQIVTLFVAG